jgi:hypothetical protein
MNKVAFVSFKREILGSAGPIKKPKLAHSSLDPTISGFAYFSLFPHFQSFLRTLFYREKISNLPRQALQGLKHLLRRQITLERPSNSKTNYSSPIPTMRVSTAILALGSVTSAFAALTITAPSSINQVIIPHFFCKTTQGGGRGCFCGPWRRYCISVSAVNVWPSVWVGDNKRAPAIRKGTRPVTPQ